MNYLLAIIFMVVNIAVAVAVARESKKITPSNQFLIGMSVMIAMITGEFVLLANGFARLMEM